MSDKEKVTLILPGELMTQVRQLAPARGQSEFIAEAITYYLASKQRKALRERLVAGYQAHAVEDADLTELWAATDDESWLDEANEYIADEEASDGPIDPAW